MYVRARTCTYVRERELLVFGFHGTWYAVLESSKNTHTTLASFPVCAQN